MRCAFTTRRAVGLLTAELIDRKEYYIHALTLALCPFLTPDAYEAPAVPGVRHA
jgi:non-canonical (house-cleaning) NTP pyrophosphatase